MAQTKPKAAQFYGVSDNGTDGQFLKTDGTGGMSWDSPITNPTITSIDYPGSATAADPAGGESVIINGTLFASGITCTVGGTSAVTAFNSATQITITTPAKAAGPYTVTVLNPDGGTASQANFIQYSGVPVWSTAAGSLGNVLEGAAASFQVTATEGSDTIEYAVTTGTLPTGLSLATATGAITGTAPAVSADTTTTFSITATDDENQTSASRSFSITVQNDTPSNHFNTVLYTGNGSAQSITSLNFAPDFTWIKERNNAINHLLFDTIRGAGRYLSSNNTLNQPSPQLVTLSSFNNNGFSVGTDGGVNGNNDTYVAWNFKAGGAAVANTDGTINSDVSVNNTLGFSIASYTGNAIAGSTVGHGLDASPDFVIIKSLNASANWIVYSSPTGNGKYLYLNSTPSAQSANWFDTSATTFTLNNTYGDANTSGRNYIAYCFASKPGFSKVGSYTGNGNTSGPMVQTGFEPAFLLVKGTDNTSSWLIYDNKRTPSNPRNNVLLANSNSADIITSNVNVDFFANGFQIKATNADLNSNSLNYIYLAFAADGSTATPSLANSFATELYTGNGGTQSVTTGFKPDLVWLKGRNATWSHFLQDSVRGAGNYLISNSTGAAGTTVPNIVSSFDTNGFTVLGNGNSNNNNDTYVSWNWKAGGTPSINTDGTLTSIVSANEAAGFSVVKYTGNNIAGATIGHGLSSAPDMIILKNTDTTDNWTVQTSDLTYTDYIDLNSTNAATTNSSVWYAAPTSTVFSFGANPRGNGNGNDIIAYCFTSISGYSKVGIYTGGSSGSSNVITIGFKPSFLMVKRTDASGDAWQMFDSTMAGSDTFDDYLQANTSAAEASYNQREVNFTNNGFYWTYAESGTNISGGTYIYLALKEN